MNTRRSQKTPHAEEPAWLAKATELKQVTLERLAAMTESERDIASTETWSASGIVEHLILTEEFVAGPWREKLLAVPGAKPGVKAAIASRVISFGFSNTGMRVPTVDGLEPAGGIRIEELELRWRAARKRLIDSLPQDDHAAWILHPALGPLSSGQMGAVLSSHLEHHLRFWPKPIP